MGRVTALRDSVSLGSTSKRAELSLSLSKVAEPQTPIVIFAKLAKRIRLCYIWLNIIILPCYQGQEGTISNIWGTFVYLAYPTHFGT